MEHVISEVAGSRAEIRSPATKAVLYLAFTEAWERFSYYGMVSLLALYMTQSLFLEPTVTGVLGLAGLKAVLEQWLGPMSTVALASQVFGLYTGLVYLTPLLGGIVADRLTGRKVAVIAGAILMSLGHFAMAFEQMFLVALALIILGCGLLKGNITAQVGELYDREDVEGRTRGFALFSMGINLGAIAGPIACGFLASRYGWHWGFGAAGVLMVASLITYLVGQRHLPGRPTVQRQVTVLEPTAHRTPGWILALAIFLTMFQSIAHYQNSNIGLIWIDANADLAIGSFLIPTAWFASFDPLASVAFVPLVLAVWRNRGDEPMMMAVGAVLAALANLMLALAALQGGKVSPLVPFLYEAMLGLAFLHYWPTLLALVSRAAGPLRAGLWMGFAFLSLFASNLLIGWLGGFYERVPPTVFWSGHAAIAAAGAVLIFGSRPLLLRNLKLNDAGQA